MESPTLLEIPEIPQVEVLHKEESLVSPAVSEFVSSSDKEYGLSSGLEEHEYFSFDDGNVTFRVENALFTVHRYFFQRDSTIFSDMFRFPASAGIESRDQGSKEDPIHLPSLNRLDFERFLKVLYPPRFGCVNLTSSEEWESVLRVADMYLFDDIRQLAIRELLLNCPDASRIRLGHCYKVRDLALTGYQKICNREEPLRSEEIASISPIDTALIIEIRENWWKNGYYSYMGETRFSESSIQEHFAQRLRILE